MWQAPSSLQKKRQGGWILRQLAEVVLDDVFIQDDGFDLIKGKPDRCWEVTQDEDKASKIEKALFETHRDVKTQITVMYVVRRKLNIQQQENALGTPLPVVVNGDATLRDAKLAESSNDKVVMWTDGSNDYDDVMRAPVLLDRPEMRPGTGHCGKTVPTHHTDPEADASAAALVSEFWMQPHIDHVHWNEVLDALQEDVVFLQGRNDCHSASFLHHR